MAGILKERARKPIISTDDGIALPAMKYIDGKEFYMLEVREPWNQDGYAIYKILLTPQEMLRAIASWTEHLSRKDARPPQASSDEAGGRN